MKSFLIAFFMLTSSFTSLRGQWEVINEGYEFRLIDFVSRDVGWMVTEDAILKTGDGGETWTPDPWNLGENFHGCEYINVMDFINDSVGWISMDTRPISGSGGAGLFKTIDGGKSWEKRVEGKSLELEYASEDMVIVSDGPRTLMRSEDRGSTWEDISPAYEFGNHLIMSFVNSDTGIAIYKGGYAQNEFIRTFDGGKTWHHRTLPEFEYLIEIGFIDNANGYLIARNNWNTSENSNYVICKTEDAFDTWIVVHENPYPIHSCYFFSKDVCIALMDDSMGCNILKSYDGGQTWSDSVSFRLPGSVHGCGDGRYEINFGNDSDGVIYSDNGYNDSRILLKSFDRGDTWSMLNLSYPFHDVCFINDQKGFVVGGVHGACCNFGDILGTIDGCRSWDFVKSRLFAIVNCEFVTDSTGFAANPWQGGILDENCYSTNLFQTTDGGVNWNEYPHEFNQFTGLKFMNEYVGFAGNDSGIYITYSGGKSWDLLLSSDETSFLIESIEYFITTIVASDENTFWAIAGDRCVIRFTSEGASEKIELETEQPLFKIFFKDENTGWIATGDYWASWYDPDPPILFKTDDGGESWYNIDYPYQFRDMYFKDSQYGWAVGMDSLDHGVILETTNGGEDWTVQVDSLNAPLNGISYKDGIAWAVGKNGLILKKYDSTYIPAIESPNKVIDGSLQFHLYPNPSNSILNIETEISGQFTIELYDLNGQLILKTVSTGTYCQLDLSSYRKGVYFITVRSKDFISTGKIIKI